MLAISPFYIRSTCLAFYRALSDHFNGLRIPISAKKCRCWRSYNFNTTNIINGYRHYLPQSDSKQIIVLCSTIIKLLDDLTTPLIIK